MGQVDQLLLIKILLFKEYILVDDEIQLTNFSDQGDMCFLVQICLATYKALILWNKN
jgi:hypothetical protein